jgi:hypothetical protein
MAAPAHVASRRPRDTAGAASTAPGRQMYRAVSVVVASAISEMPKWSASTAGACGSITAQAPRPACSSRKPSISGASTRMGRWDRYSASTATNSATISRPSTPVTARWLNSIAAANVKSGTSLPLHSGQFRPQPCADPVLVTRAPITSTRSMPAAARAPSQKTARRTPSDRLTRARVPD